MAILDHPLFGTEAYGRIKNTLLYFKRVPNKNYTDPDPGERFHITSKLSFPDSLAVAREDHKNKFKVALQAWYSLPQSDKNYWETQATGLQTGFNAYMKNFLLSG